MVVQMHDSSDSYMHIKACKGKISTRLNTVFSSYCYTLGAQFTLWIITAYSMWQDGWRLKVIYTPVMISKHTAFF